MFRTEHSSQLDFYATYIQDMASNPNATFPETLDGAHQLNFLEMDAAMFAEIEERYRIQARMHRERYRMEKAMSKASRMREAGLRLDILRKKLQTRERTVDAVPTHGRSGAWDTMTYVE